MHKIFVYGTLKTGQPNHHWLQNENNGIQRKLDGLFFTKSKFPMVLDTPWNIPFLIDHENFGKSIYGEVYEVDDLMLSKLDILEGYPKWYDRKTIQVEQSGSVSEAQVYLLNNVDHDKFLKRYKGRHLLLNNFDAKLVDYVPPEKRPTNYREVSLSILECLKSD